MGMSRMVIRAILRDIAARARMEGAFTLANSIEEFHDELYPRDLFYLVPGFDSERLRVHLCGFYGQCAEDMSLHGRLRPSVVFMSHDRSLTLHARRWWPWVVYEDRSRSRSTSSTGSVSTVVFWPDPRDT